MCRWLNPWRVGFRWFIHGGVRRGTDVFEALALGASGVYLPHFVASPVLPLNCLQLWLLHVFHLCFLFLILFPKSSFWILQSNPLTIPNLISLISQSNLLYHSKSRLTCERSKSVGDVLLSFSFSFLYLFILLFPVAKCWTRPSSVIEDKKSSFLTWKVLVRKTQNDVNYGFHEKRSKAPKVASGPNS